MEREKTTSGAKSGSMIRQLRESYPQERSKTENKRTGVQDNGVKRNIKKGRSNEVTPRER